MGAVFFRTNTLISSKITPDVVQEIGVRDYFCLCVVDGLLLPSFVLLVLVIYLFYVASTNNSSHTYFLLGNFTYTLEILTWIPIWLSLALFFIEC